MHCLTTTAALLAALQAARAQRAHIAAVSLHLLLPRWGQALEVHDRVARGAQGKPILVSVHVYAACSAWPALAIVKSNDSTAQKLGASCSWDPSLLASCCARRLQLSQAADLRNVQAMPCAAQQRRGLSHSARRWSSTLPPAGRLRPLAAGHDASLGSSLLSAAQGNPALVCHVQLFHGGL